MRGERRDRWPVVVGRRTRLPVAAPEVWHRVTTPEGLADELRPWLRMTTPPGLRDRSVVDVPIGLPLGRAWLLLGGVLPVEYDDLCLAELATRHFEERSRTLVLTEWVHRREVLGDGPGACVVVDHLRATPRSPLHRLPLAPQTVGTLVGALFSHRRRRLARWASKR